MKKYKQTFLMVLMVLLGIVMGIAGNQYTNRDQQRIKELLALIESNSYYFDEAILNEDRLLEGALRGIVEEVGDPYSVFLDEEDLQAFLKQLQSSFAGIGVSIVQTGKYPLVVNVIPNSPAEQAGIKRGDVLLRVGETSVLGLTPRQIASYITGNKGEKRTLTIAREDINSPFSVEVELAQVTSKTVISSFYTEYDQKIGLIKVTNFSSNTFDDFKLAMEQLKLQGMTDLIIDVRDNPGGYLHIVMEMLDLLMDGDGPLLYIRNRKGELLPQAQDKYKADVNYQILILINSNSASASEIFAATLNESRGIELIGTTTFGKGTVQKTYYLDQKKTIGVKLTTENWLTPKKKWIQDVGVAPTHEVHRDRLDHMYYIDFETTLTLDTVNLNAIGIQAFFNFIGFETREDGYIDSKTITTLRDYQESLIEEGVRIQNLGQLDFTTVFHMNLDLISLLENPSLDEQYQYAYQLALNN